jgi:hypothetical protein
MRKKPRDYNRKSPLECFREEYENRNITRGQLKIRDSSLYRALHADKQMDEAIPEKRGVTYRGYASPLECFRAKFGKRKITRNQLAEKDLGLYKKLCLRGQIAEAIPEKKGNNYRGYASPLEFFKHNFENKIITRGKLKVKDARLYSALRSWEQLDLAIPPEDPAERKAKLETILRRYANAGGN